MSTQDFGLTIKQEDLDREFLTGPGEDIVRKTILQMQKVPQFVKLFGTWDPAKPDISRWADYQRFDWSIRMLPAINVFFSQNEEKQSENSYLPGNVSFQVYWPPNQRRSDLQRVQAAFKGIMENLFASAYVGDMLDELYYIQRDNKVYGLNEYGKNLTWPPNVEGIVESELVPVTIVEAKYRIDLRSWYRALEFMNRTKDEPFKETLADLTRIEGEYDGNIDDGTTEVAVPDGINVQNP